MKHNIRVGAEHEIAHALAYIAHGRPFIDVELDDIGCGAVNVVPWAGRQDEVACIKMAGPAADFAYLAERDGEDSALAFTVETWCKLLLLADHEDDPDAMRSDQAGAAGSGLIAYGFAWAVGFCDANRALIAELAGLLLANGGRLTYDDVVAATGGRLRGADETVTIRLLTDLGWFADVVSRVQKHVQALQQESPRPRIG